MITRAEVRTLLLKSQPPCVSLFMPTHRGGAEQDPIRWKNLLAQAEERLHAGGLRASRAREMLGPARSLLDDPAFWKNQSDGLAFFLAPTLVHGYRLPLAFEELVVVADRPHVKPLLRLLGNNGTFYLLAISQNKIRLLQGTHYSVQELDLKGVPTSLAQALQFHDRDEPLMFHTRPAGGIGSWGAIFHGQGVGIDDYKDDLLHYFQIVDRGIHDLLRNEHAPLVLAGVEFLWPIYQRANSYPHLLAGGVAGNPDRLSVRELHDRAWAVVEPHFREAQERAVALYAQLAGTGRTTDSLEELIRAAYRGQIEILFVAEGKQCWGQYDPARDAVTLHERPVAGDEDLLNFAAIHALLFGATVYVVRPEGVPGGKSAAGIFWLPLAKRG
jgi:hypothetical protein